MNSEREKQIAVIILMANITGKLGNSLTKSVNDFRRKIRKFLNRLYKHERKLYDKSLELATNSWNLASKNECSDMSVASTLDSLYLLIEDVPFVKKKLFTSRQFIVVYASIVGDKDEELTQEVEQASKEFTESLASALGYEKKKDLKRLIYTIRQNSIIKKG